MDLIEVGWKGMDWIHVTQDWGKWYAVLNVFEVSKQCNSLDAKVALCTK